MRIFNSFLIFCGLCAFASTSLSQAEKNHLTVNQARGLKKGSCYEESAALTCHQDCIADLFPGSQAQTAVTIIDPSPGIRKAPGRLFKIKFRIENESADQAVLLSFMPITVDDLRKDLRKRSGLVHSQECEVKALK